MVRLQFPYLDRVVSKGRVYYRYRRGGRLHKLPNDPSSRAFYDEYIKIHTSYERDPRPVVAADSVAAVIDAFKRSPDFTGLSDATRVNYKTHLTTLDTLYGEYPISAVNRGIVLAFRDAMLTKPNSDRQYPARANYAVEVFRRLLSFALDRGLIVSNPAAHPGRIKGGSYQPWTEAQIKAFRETAAPQLVLALDVALCTGQRLGDILAMTWAQIDDNGIRLTQGKTGAKLWVPMHKTLLTTINRAKKTRTSTHIITTTAGQPYKVRHFSAEWLAAAKAAGVSSVKFHGLRKTATVYLAEAGCTPEQIKAITGHKTDAMVAHYSAGANQKKMARAAMEKLESAQPNLIKLHNFSRRVKK